MSRNSESRRTRRYLARKGEVKALPTMYGDNKGHEYKYKFVAKMASFFNILSGCLKNGFPIAVKNLWYVAWAFYPFFFIRRDAGNPIPQMNHERIHIRQQRELHTVISLPLLILIIWQGWYQWILPLIFVPSFVYMIQYIVEVARAVRKNPDQNIKKSLKEARLYIPMELEATINMLDEEYLFTRKSFAWLRFTGIKMFKNYGTPKKTKK